MTIDASPSSTRRLFTALWPRESVRDALARWQDDWRWPPSAAVVARERLHITLHFLGSVPVARMDELRAALQLPSTPFQLEFGRAEVWHGGIAVLHPHQVPDALADLQARIGIALKALNIPTEVRPYRPHVTLARRAAGAQPPRQDPRLRWDADEGFVLVESLPGGRGYKVLDRF